MAARPHKQHKLAGIREPTCRWCFRPATVATCRYCEVEFSYMRVSWRPFAYCPEHRNWQAKHEVSVRNRTCQHTWVTDQYGEECSTCGMNR